MPTQRRALAAATAAAAVLLSCGGGDGADGTVRAAGDRSVVVMTRNLYLGSALAFLESPGSAANLPASVRAAYDEVRASSPPERMARIADEIAAAGADLVGLQEAARFATLLPPATAEAVDYDFVTLVLDALRARGLSYRAVEGATSTNFDERLPDDSGRIVHFTDRDVILARDGVATRDAANGSFAQQLRASFAGFSIGIPRGWGAVTADANGATLRFVNTHLEAVDDPARTREAQAREVAAVAAASPLPTVLVGDFNSPPAEATGAYGAVRAGGLADAWDRLRPGEAGLTCCFDGTLRGGPLRTRIDVVWSRGAVTPLSADVVGEEAADRTASGLAPSDHAGVVARLAIGG